MIPSTDIAKVFSALSHPSRVDILLCLMPRPKTGLTAGALSKETAIPPSTLAHHLREMEEGRVIRRTQEGRKTIVTPCLDTLTGIAGLLTRLCCSEENEDRS